MEKPEIERKCDGCTECCRGWLSGQAYGKSFYPGNPCHFVSEKGCSIYKDRPHDPCVTFKCGWLIDSETFPEWMKPNVAKILAKVERTKSGIQYYGIYECGQKIDSVVLNNLILSSLNNNVNIRVQVNGGWTNYGTREYLEDLK